MFYGQVEGTDIVVLDKRFASLFAGYMRVSASGPARSGRKAPPGSPPGRYLVWSDIPNNRMMR